MKILLALLLLAGCSEAGPPLQVAKGSAQPTGQPASHPAAVTACSGEPEFHDRRPPGPGPGFPELSPVSNVMPEVRVQKTLQLPKRVVVRPDGARLVVSLDAATLEPVTITTACHMLIGARMEYEVGSSHDSMKSVGYSLRGNEVEFKEGDSTFADRPSPNGPVIVRVTLSIFETDIPAQHMWMPESKRYKVLEKRVLEATVP